MPWEVTTGKITSNRERTVLFELSLEGKVRLLCGAIKRKDGHKLLFFFFKKIVVISNEISHSKMNEIKKKKKGQTMQRKPFWVGCYKRGSALPNVAPKGSSADPAHCPHPHAKVPSPQPNRMFYTCSHCWRSSDEGRRAALDSSGLNELS